MGDSINSSAEILPYCLSSSFVLCTKHRVIGECMKYFINKKLLIILIAFFVSIAVFAEIPSMEEMYKIMDKVFDTGNF